MDQLDYSDLEVAPASQKEAVEAPQKEAVAPDTQGANVNTIWGLRRRTFWLIALAVVAILIAAGVGGGIAAQNAKKNKSSSVSEATLSPTTTTTEAETLPTLFSDSPQSTINNTGLAIASWRSSTNNTMLNARLFYQGNSGEIRERSWTSETGWSNNSTQILDITARSNTPFSQVNIATKVGSREIQLFYLNQNNTVCDLIYTTESKWTKGKLESQNITVGADSKLAAMPWKGGSEVQLYYQDSDDAVHEVKWSGDSWSRSDIPGFLTTAKGSGMALLYSVEGKDEQVRMYVQTPDRAIVSKDFIRGEWFPPYKIHTSTATLLGTSISATIVNLGLEYQGLVMVRVYFLGEDGIVKVLTWDDGWSSNPKNLVEGTGRSAIAAIDWDKKNGRVYFEMKGGLGEIITEDGFNWNTSSFGT